VQRAVGGPIEQNGQFCSSADLGIIKATSTRDARLLFGGAGKNQIEKSAATPFG